MGHHADITQLVQSATLPRWRLQVRILLSAPFAIRYMMNKSEIGERTEAMVLAALVKAGKHVLMPFGNSRRYDLVIDENGKFIRVQCKTGRLKDGAIHFRTTNVSSAGKNLPYTGQVDCFGIYCPENNKVYLVPIEDLGLGSCVLRIEPRKNNQQNDIRSAVNYEMGD